MIKRANFLSRIAILALLVAGLASCSGGKEGPPKMRIVLFNFSPQFGGIHLNAPLELTFTNPVDPASVNSDSIRIFTTTTTSQDPDPGAPAIGDFLVIGNVVRFLPQIPSKIGNQVLSDTGLKMGFTYTIQVPGSPDVIAPVRSIEGDPNEARFEAFFTTLNQTILPAPGDITAEPNLPSLHLFFLDEGIELGVDPCPREPPMPVADWDSPQVIKTDPQEGESGFGTITGIQPGLGTAFVRLDPLTLEFSEPIGPWRVREQNISIFNTNLGGETFDLSFSFRQDRDISILIITVFDADSAFDQGSVPQGQYVLQLTDFTDLAGNQLVNSQGGACDADGSFSLTFSTVSSPTKPTNLTLTFDDDDGEGHVDVGGLRTGTNDPNVFPEHATPFLGGVSVDQPGITTPSPSNQATSANWGSIGFWTGAETRFDNGYDELDPTYGVPDALRLRGGSEGAATPIMAPIVGRGSGRSSTDGALDGSVFHTDGSGRVDFFLDGDSTARLFSGDASTGPIVYHYHQFDLLETTGGRPLLTARDTSIFPLVIFVETDAMITGDIVLDGGNGQFGFEGANDGSTGNVGRNPGGAGGNGMAGGGDGGAGGSFTLGNINEFELLNGQTGAVPVNVLGTLDQLSESVAGLDGMATGGGGHWDETQPAGTTPPPAYQGGGGAGQASDGETGQDWSSSSPGRSDQGVRGNQFGSGLDFSDENILASGGAGGGGGGAVDHSQGSDDPDDTANQFDSGGGGAGAGGGYLSLTCGGTMTLGEIDEQDPDDPTDDLLSMAVVRCVGGRGGSTYQNITGSPPQPARDDGAGNLTEDVTGQIGQGNAGGGGGGGGFTLIAGDQIELIAAELYAYGKRGGNSPDFEGDESDDPPFRTPSDEAGAGGGGVGILLDSDNFTVDELPAQLGGNNVNIQVEPDPARDLSPPDGVPDLDPNLDTDIIQDLNEMSGLTFIDFDEYGDDPNEALFAESKIATEFFDTLSDAVAYDEVRILSNTPDYHHAIDAGDADKISAATIRFFVDSAQAAGSGLPDLSTEQADGSLLSDAGGTLEIGTMYDLDGANTGAPLYESRRIIDSVVGAPLQGKRFVRVRIVFDISQGGVMPNDLLNTFDPPTGTDVLIAPMNSVGNTDTAPQGVPAVAEVRVRFIP